MLPPGVRREGDEPVDLPEEGGRGGPGQVPEDRRQGGASAQRHHGPQQGHPSGHRGERRGQGDEETSSLTPACTPDF